MPRYAIESKKSDEEGGAPTIGDWISALRGALEEKLKPTDWDKFDPPTHLLKTVGYHLTKGEMSELWGALKQAHAEKEIALEHHAAAAEKWGPIDPDYELRRSGPKSFARARTEFVRRWRGLPGPAGVPGQPAPAPRHADVQPATRDLFNPFPQEGLLELMRWLRGSKADGGKK